MNPMKLTIIASGQDGSHQKSLKEAAVRRGLDAEICGITAEEISTGKANAKLGEAVIWRRSELDLHSERASLEPSLGKRITVSDSIFKYPSVRFKYYQQQMLREDTATSKWSIPTFRFKNAISFNQAIEEGLLSLPVIAKPNASSRGQGIELIREKDDISKVEHIKDYVFQNFIPNKCDWRVIVVGGAPLGVLSRSAQNGHFTNNISTGGQGNAETNEEVLSTVRKIATKAASVFHLTFCGVDIIKDSETGQYYVLEVNTAPQWLGEFGFQNITGVQVADTVIDWIIDRKSLDGTTSVADSVEQYYKKRIEQIPSEAFHLASRLWLWTGDSWGRGQLDAMKQQYIGSNSEEVSSRIKKMVERGDAPDKTVNRHKSYRKTAFDKYGKLSLYNALLFKTVFCDSVYDLDIRPYIKQHISDKEFITLFNELIDDEDSVRLLSTHAVNYFYLLGNYFKGSLNLSSSVLVSPQELINLLPGYEALEEQGIIDKKTSVKLQIYLLTHAVLGQSRFYARRVKLSIYKELCRQVEELIKDNYFEVSLDNKFEFLVCSQICGYETSIRELIEQEAEKSISWAGNFLVDKAGEETKSRAGHCLRSSEHRNVLYIMSQRPFHRTNSSISTKVKTKLPTIGRLARVKLPNNGIRRAIARVDSGASISAISSSNVHEADGVLHFTLFDENHPLYTGEEFVTDDFSLTSPRNTTGQQERYAVVLKIEVMGVNYDVLFGLADRQQMLYPILIGRNFLKGHYTVDTSRQFIEKKTKAPRKGTL